MKTRLTNLIPSGAFSVNFCLKLLYNTVKISSRFAQQSRAFFSTSSQPEAPVKVYENVHTQKREILEENRGKGCVYM
jgi:hypothetical protein